MPSSNTHIITYKGKLKDGFFRDNIAPYFLKKTGEKGVLIAGKIFPFLYPFGFVILEVALLWLIFLLTGFSFPIELSLILFAQLLFFSSFYFTYQISKVSEYLQDIQCKRCGREFACREIRFPDIREVSTPESYFVEITRYWKCAYCDFEDTRTGSEGLVAEKWFEAGRYRLNRIKCKRCGKTHAYEDLKKGDMIKRERPFSERMTFTWYYRCKFCGYEDIERSESTFNYSDIAG